MKVFLISLGCDKNRVDSEEMLGFLEDAGFSFTDTEENADIIIINTCCFIDAAKEESIETILAMARMKEYGKCRKLIVTGCLAERYKKEILKEMPEIDAVVGVNELEKVVLAAAGGEPDARKAAGRPLGRVITTPGHYEFLKIAEGCDKRCTYCIIPYIRGSYRSRPMEELTAEAERLASAGVKELILVAQETTVYGTDLYKKKMLPGLLERLCRIDGLKWIRLLYTYPEEIDDELLAVMAREEKIVKYIDMPVQHASDNILRKMGRRTTRAELEEKIARIREVVPGVVLRTTLISGFPGETDADHEVLKEFVRKSRFDRLGVFTYSREEGTPAAEFAHQVPDKVKAERQDELMRIQEEISGELLKENIGRELELIVEGYLPEDRLYVGRSYMDAPDVDGYFYFKSKKELFTGQTVRAVCTDSGLYDLYGEMLYESSE